MNRTEAKDFYHILQAFSEGKTIECRTKSSVLHKSWQDMNNWTEMKEFVFLNNTEYRIKPEPKYRPFKDAEECWNEMQKHQPFGWIRNKFNPNGVIGTIIFLDNRKEFRIVLDFGEGKRPIDMMNSFIFSDGTPFGIKVEE